MLIIQKKRNILLIRPQISIAFSQSNPPIGLGYLASVLEREGLHVDIIDLSVTHITDSTLISFIKRKNPVFIGISALTAYYMEMKRISNLIKNELPSYPVVLGGIHASSLPVQSVIECKADFVVIGEGEATICELADTLLNNKNNFNKIKGIAFREGEQVYVNPSRDLIENLDTLPLPAWHKINPRHYPAVPHGFIMKYRPVSPIMSTRGCPFSCSYCASCQFWKKKIRFRNPTKVVDEIEYLNKKFGIREFHFWDDNLTLKRDHVHSICIEIIRRRLNIALATPNGIRVDTLDESILRLMRKAGFYQLTFAVESGSLMILRSNNKNTSLRTILKNTILAKQLGFDLNAFFMIGFPQESLETIRKTINFAKSLPFDMRSFFIVRPLPGSVLFNSWIQNRETLHFNWDNINFFRANDSLSAINSKQLENWLKKAYNETIIRFPNILQYFHFRFVKYGHLYQIKFLVARVIFIILGFNVPTHKFGLKT